MSYLSKAFERAYTNPSEDTVFTLGYAMFTKTRHLDTTPAAFVKSEVFKTYSEALDCLWSSVCHEAEHIHFIARIDDVLEAGEVVDINVDSLTEFDKDIQAIEYTTKNGLVCRIKISSNHL